MAESFLPWRQTWLSLMTLVAISCSGCNPQEIDDAWTQRMLVGEWKSQPDENGQAALVNFRNDGTLAAQVIGGSTVRQIGNALTGRIEADWKINNGVLAVRITSGTGLAARLFAFSASFDEGEWMTVAKPMMNADYDSVTFELDSDEGTATLQLHRINQ